MAMEGSHLTAEEGADLADLLMEQMLDTLAPDDRFDQILGCMDFLLM